VDRTFEQLLAGDDQVHIKALLLTGQGKRVVVDDEQLTRYVTEAFRSAVRARPKFGVSYDGYVYLSTGGPVQCSIHVHEEQAILSVSEPINGIWVNDPLTYYLVTLPEPIPQDLVQMLAELRKGTKGIKGELRVGGTEKGSGGKGLEND
jgi:hypothetical protein